MPAVNPRVQVSLSRASYKALAVLAKRESRSMSSIAGEMLTQLLPHIGAAYSLAQELKTKSPAYLAAVRDMAETVDRVNAVVLGEMQAEARDLSQICKKCGNQMSSVAHAKTCGADPRQVDVEDAIAASVKTAAQKPVRGAREQIAGRMAGKAPRPPGTNRGV
jgi:hypothetical protein